LIVDSYRFLPRSFRPLYEGRGPLPGEEGIVWTPFEKRLSEAKIALLSSAGLYIPGSQASFDLDGERAHPEWGDPTWRSIPATTENPGVAHLHINDDDLLADPEIALPMRMLAELAAQGVVGGAVEQHVAVMGYQERELGVWRKTTAPQIAAHLSEQGADALVLAPA
jgi:hypothetical protein